MFSEVKTRERDIARKLRREEGLPINEIARRVSVSKSSVSIWVRDIELTPQQEATLRAKNPAYNRQLSGWRQNAAKHRANRVAAQESGRTLARRYEPLHLAGCMLYWAEGSKRRNQLCFSNSDPEMVRFFVAFVAFLKTYFDIRDTDIKITCHLFADHIERQREVEQFWLTEADLPGESLRKSVVNVYSRSSKRKRINKLPYGTCQVVVSRTWVLQSILGSIQEYAGFEREAWLE
jgi:transcriptional regulator with XRE-family HTH domain